MKEGATTEQLTSPEAGEYSSRVLLHFARHGDKTSDPDKSNVEQVLTEIGRRQGWDKGKALGPATPTAMAFGGDVLRSQEMGGFMLAGAEDNEGITGQETLDELRAKLDEDRKVGTRLAVDPRLSFHYESPEVWRVAGGAYKKGGGGLKWMVENSDQLVMEHGNERETSYSRVASNIAQVLEKYAKIAPRFDAIVSDEEKMKQYGDTLERMMGSHAGAIDYFLCKLVEVMRGKGERDRLISMCDEMGFDVAEGFDVEIDMVNGEPQMRVKYEKKSKDGEEDFVFNENIPPEVLEQIIAEGEATKNK